MCHKYGSLFQVARAGDNKSVAAMDFLETRCGVQSVRKDRPRNFRPLRVAVAHSARRYPVQAATLLSEKGQSPKQIPQRLTLLGADSATSVRRSTWTLEAVLLTQHHADFTEWQAFSLQAQESACRAFCDFIVKRQGLASE